MNSKVTLKINQIGLNKSIFYKSSPEKQAVPITHPVQSIGKVKNASNDSSITKMVHLRHCL